MNLTVLNTKSMLEISPFPFDIYVQLLIHFFQHNTAKHTIVIHQTIVFLNV